MTAARRRLRPSIVSRKVGTPQSRMLARARSGRPDGQCNREQTADGPVRRSQARVKRCGKSAPACGAIPTARSTPSGARSSRRHGLLVRPGQPGQPPGRSLRWMVTGAGNGPTGSRLQTDSPSPPESQPPTRVAHAHPRIVRTPVGQTTLGRPQRVATNSPVRRARRRRAGSARPNSRQAHTSNAAPAASRARFHHPRATTGNG